MTAVIKAPVFTNPTSMGAFWRRQAEDILRDQGKWRGVVICANGQTAWHCANGLHELCRERGYLIDVEWVFSPVVFRNFPEAVILAYAAKGKIKKKPAYPQRVGSLNVPDGDYRIETVEGKVILTPIGFED